MDTGSGGSLNSGNMQEIEREKYFLNIMTPRQKERYDSYRAAKLPKTKIEKVRHIAQIMNRKIVQEIMGSNAPVDKKIAVLIGGLAKVYAGELVEEAKMIQEQEGDRGKIKPHQLAEARRRAIKKGALRTSRPKPLFKKR